MRKSIIQSFSSYQLTTKEDYALPFSLDDKIPERFSENRIKTDFGSFYYHILKYTKDQLKSKIKRKCGNYSQLKIPYRYPGKS